MMLSFGTGAGDSGISECIRGSQAYTGRRFRESWGSLDEEDKPLCLDGQARINESLSRGKNWGLVQIILDYEYFSPC